MEAIQIATYSRTLRQDLPPEAFRRHPGRLLWLPLHWAVVTLGILLIARGWGGSWVAALLSLVIGHSFACTAFVAHETLHGSVVRPKWVRLLVGWLAFLPFALSPRLWIVWHNVLHHGHTMDPAVDPDVYPSLAKYRARRALRIIDHAALGRGHPLGFLSIILGFSVQSLQVLFTVGGMRRRMSRRTHLLAIGETLAAVGLMVGLGFVIGWPAMLFAFVIPLLVANAVLMTYILTNHGLSPYSDVNDPLFVALSVTTPRLSAWLHLNFGFHVEHHVFPAMSPASAPLVRQMILLRWPGRYQSMSLSKAIWRMLGTSRLHGTATTLVDPRDGREWPTLLPHEEGARADAPPRTPPSE